jgi:hypothetical protein
MGSSAFEIVFIAVLRGMVYGVVMGTAMLALMRAPSPTRDPHGQVDFETEPEDRVRSAPGA